MLRYLALGDSYTIGEGVQEEQRWPIQLCRMLRKEGIGIAEPEIVARTGWTTGELLDGIAQAQPLGRYTLVSLLIGVNNQYRQGSLVDYGTEFRHLLRQAIAFTGGCAARVLVPSIPDWGITPFATGRDQARIAAEIDAFNDIKCQATLAMGAIFADITSISRLSGAEPVMLADDGLHPSGAMYTLWARTLVPLARHALRRNGE